MVLYCHQLSLPELAAGALVAVSLEDVRTGASVIVQQNIVMVTTSPPMCSKTLLSPPTQIDDITFF